MTTPADPLTPVRDALLATAHADAARLLAETDAETEEVLAHGRAEADAIRARSRAQGEADAASVLVTERSRARRQARAVVLAAQQAAYAELCARAAEATESLRADPGYGRWRDRVREQVRLQLGDEVVVTELPEGGVLGEVPGRRLEHTLRGLAEQAVEALGPEVEGLWTA